MRDILIVGAGKIGTVIADLLASSGDYAVTVADRDPAAVERVGADDFVPKYSEHELAQRVAARIGAIA